MYYTPFHFTRIIYLQRFSYVSTRYTYIRVAFALYNELSSTINLPITLQRREGISAHTHGLHEHAEAILHTRSYGFNPRNRFLKDSREETCNFLHVIKLALIMQHGSLIYTHTHTAEIYSSAWYRMIDLIRSHYNSFVYVRTRIITNH